MLAVLAPGVVLAADACDDVQVVDVAATVRVAVALTVCERRDWLVFLNTTLSNVKALGGLFDNIK